MRIQAIATLFTAAAVSLFQAPDAVDPMGSGVPVPAVTSEALPSSIVWEANKAVPGERLLQSESKATPAGGTPEESGFAADSPIPGLEIEISGPAFESTFANNTSEEPIDLTQEPDFVDVPDPTPSASVDAVAEGVEPIDLVVEDFESKAPVDAVAEEVKPVDLAVENFAPAVESVDLDADATDFARKGEDSPVPLPIDLTVDAGGPDLNAGSLSMPVETGVPSVPIAAVEDSGASEAAGLATRLIESASQALSVPPAPQGSDTESAEEVNQPTMGEEDGGFWLRGARLNEVFQYLARIAGRQYFHNTELDAANFVVTGHLGDGDPINQMEELGLMYGITVLEKGETVYALTQPQLAQLPTKPFQYHLNYLRPTDIDQIQAILQPVLTQGSGTVNYEQKTNTLIVIDNEQKIDSIKEILAELDQPKEQIAIETRILRIKSSSRNRIGVDWTTVLGDGLTFEGTEALNALFNLPDSDLVDEIVTVATNRTGEGAFTIAERGDHPEFGAITGTDSFEIDAERTQEVLRTGSHLVLNPLQLQATLRALNAGGLAEQESSPTLVTEDNEPGIISIIDRVPIIIATVSETTAGQNISEEVRYRIDTDDPVDDPASTREIGVTVAVTPTILPDNTIRMALRPRSAQIVDFVEGRSGNLFPRVTESTVDTIARIPNGHSLLIGGFYEETTAEDINKVPILGDIPGLNFLFKSSDMQKEHTSLVFVVTPKYYNPVSIPESDRMTRGLHNRHVLPQSHSYPDRRSPGDNYEPRLGATLGNAFNLYPQDAPSNPLNPAHPVNTMDDGWSNATPSGMQVGASGRPPESMEVRPVNRERKGLFSKLFKKRNR